MLLACPAGEEVPAVRFVSPAAEKLKAFINPDGVVIAPTTSPKELSPLPIAEEPPSVPKSASV
jgi:hypothetical protein